MIPPPTSFSTTPEIRVQLEALPLKPGVYVFYDAKDVVIYVGKAKILRNRVRSYFHQSSLSAPKLSQMVQAIARLEILVTESEIEALMLECNLIKEHRPKYNIRLKDDSQYLYLRISLQDPYPRLSTARSAAKDGARYFGPNADSRAVRRTLALLRQIFLLRTCSLNFDTKPCARPCLDYFIHLCSAPCARRISLDKYREAAEEACLFLTGEQQKLLDQLRSKMLRASKALAYEQAAVIRDQLQALEKNTGTRRVLSMDPRDQDVISVATQQEFACVQVLFIRRGVMVGQQHHILENVLDQPLEPILLQFLTLYYQKTVLVKAREGSIPAEILLPIDLGESSLITEWLTQQKGASVRLRRPLTDHETQVLRMATENAEVNLHRFLEQPETIRRITNMALAELQAALGLEYPPHRIEAFDISTIQGTASVGSMVVFEEGQPRKAEYRRYKIRTVSGLDDFAMMREIVTRRYRRVLNGSHPLPDLIVIDGGRGQLNAAIGALAELGVDDVPIVGIAKRFEEIYLRYRQEPVQLPVDSQGAFLIQRVRDEAHRFAVTYHRVVRQKTTGVPKTKRHRSSS